MGSLSSGTTPGAGFRTGSTLTSPPGPVCGPPPQPGSAIARTLMISRTAEPPINRRVDMMIDLSISRADRRVACRRDAGALGLGLSLGLERTGAGPAREPGGQVGPIGTRP